jgi:hypothetical protein
MADRKLRGSIKLQQQWGGYPRPRATLTYIALSHSSTPLHRQNPATASCLSWRRGGARSECSDDAEGHCASATLQIPNAHVGG